MQVAKWGNSLAIRLPMALVKTMNLAEGDEVELTARGTGKLALAVKPSKEAIIAALREFEGHLPADFKFERDKANER